MKCQIFVFFFLGCKTPMTPRRSTRLQSKREKTPEVPYEPRGPRAMMKLNKSKTIPDITISTPSKTSKKVVPEEQVKEYS